MVKPVQKVAGGNCLSRRGNSPSPLPLTETQVTTKYGSHHFTGYGENASHFPITSLWELSVEWQPNQDTDKHKFSHF